MSTNNAYRITDGTGKQSSWDYNMVYGQLNWMYSKTRGMVDGWSVYKRRNYPGSFKKRGVEAIAASYRSMDEMRTQWYELEDSGAVPHVYVTVPYGEVMLNYDLSCFFIYTPQMADMIQVGWTFRVA